MSKQRGNIDSELAAWIAQQRVFFVATAPLSPHGHINASPKGGDAFRVLGPLEVAYQDYTGSGVETAAHLQENGRIVVMFCAFAAGASPIRLIKGKTPIDCLIEGYLRSPRFADCLRVLIEAGATMGDPLLEALLFDDDAGLRRLLNRPGQSLDRRLRAPCAFTSCEGVTPLHICAEFNCVRCARVLLDAGVDVDAPADIDADGFGGQTRIFHAVNSILNYCRPAMELLVEAGADLDVRLKGLGWGRGQDWETLVLDVTPVSYAQCGLYAQFHRAEHDVYSNLRYLYRKRHAAELRVRNVPNKYLAPRA